MNIWLTPSLRSQLIHQLAGSLTLNIREKSLHRSGLKHALADVKYLWACVPAEDRRHVVNMFRSAFAFHRSLYR